MNQLRSKESEAINFKNVRGEYPRPYLKRDSFFNLNGVWDYAISNAPHANVAMTGKILVPFPIESLLSGVMKPLKKHEYLIYRRTFTLPEGFVKDITLLHFEAVDYECFVYLNHRKIFFHKGGYLPFAFDISNRLAEGENELVVVVKDDTENDGAATGKQKIKRGGMWYTPCSGIWQSVWIESVNQLFIEDVKITPNIDSKTVSFEIKTADPHGEITVREGEETIAQMKFVSSHVELAIPHPKLWSPEHPNLYDVEIKTPTDTITSYFAMRKVGIGTSAYGQCLTLNDKPYFMNGVLDQGYYSDGNYTASSEEAIINDILTMKKLGFNTLRKHIKVEDRRFYYQCDRLGMLVWQDMPCGGKYSFMNMTIRPTLGLTKFSDSSYNVFGRQKETNRKDFIDETWSTIKLLGHYSCIVMWVIFNEGWGQFDAKEIASAVKKEDPSRLVDHASGWFDQGGGDVASIHTYFRKLKFVPDELKRPVVCSEFGGYSHQVKDHVFNPDKEFGYRKFPVQKDFENAVIRLYEDEVIPSIKTGLCAAIYTQLSDVEDETNGFLTYDRKVLKVDERRVHAVMEKVKF